MAYTQYLKVQLGAAYEGLTLYAQLKDTSNVNVGGQVTSGFVEKGDGDYCLSVSIPDDFRGSVDFYNSADDAYLTSIPINPEEAQTSLEILDLVLASSGGSDGQYSITINVQASSAAVQGASVAIYDSANTLRVAGPLSTNSLGKAFFNLDADSYKVRVSAGAAYETLAVQTLTVSADDAVTYTLTPIAIDPPASADLCRVYGFAYDLNGDPVAGRVLTFELVSAKAVSSNGVVLDMTPTTATTDADGYFEVDLIKDSALEPEDGDTAKWRVHCQPLRLDHGLSLTGSTLDITDMLAP